ncbi:MAG: hypothetical protein K940chlam9_01076 [Chlamydiae bacterium]|nr:hypothetical protein [Chlamydiota bacterium]
MKREFTGTVYIIEEDRTLLLFHKKLQKWLPPGGHLEPNELPFEGALREAKEETGLDVELLRGEQIWISPTPNGRSIPRPFMCLQETIPPLGNTPAHEHIDLIFVGRPVGGTLRQNDEESFDLRWFTLETLSQLEVETDIFEDVLRVASYLLSQASQNQFHHRGLEKSTEEEIPLSQVLCGSK